LSFSSVTDCRPLSLTIWESLQPMPEHRIFAAVYDRFMAAAEKAGLREMRHGVVGEASGRTLELGAGTGHNLDHYTGAVSELVLTEPDPHMAKRLRGKVGDQPPAPAS